MGPAFLAITQCVAQAIERQSLALPDGFSLLMGASAKGQGVVTKLVSVIPGNARKGLPVTTGLALLVDEKDGQPLALFDATALTAWRTAAAVGFVTRLLARNDAGMGLLVGSGTQARAQLLAMDAARPLEEIRIMARNAQRIEQLVTQVQGEVRARLRVIGNDEKGRLQAVAEAEVLTAATTSAVPVIPGAEIRPGCHVNGIGSFRPDMCEFDQDLVRRSVIFVESRATSSAEAGELIAGIHSGKTAVAQWREVGEVIGGTVSGRSNPLEITFYKSVGHGVLDLFAASAVLRHAQARGLGTEWAM